MDLEAHAVLGDMHDEAARLHRESAILTLQEKCVQLEKTRLAAQLASIEKEEHEMKAQLARVNRKLAVTEQRIATFNSLSLLLARVPVEIWRLVFTWLREMAMSNHVLWRLGHVCHKWREIAHGDAYLWNDISIDTISVSRCSSAALEKQLELSRSATLHVAFRGSMVDDHDLCYDLLDISARHSSRWERFEVDWEGDMSVFNALSDIAGRLDRLRYLRVFSLPTESFPDEEDWNETWPMANAFRTAPLLEDVFLTWKGGCCPASPVVRLPPTVKRLRIAAQPKDLVRVLHDAPDIVELVFREVTDKWILFYGGFVFMNAIERLHLTHSKAANRIISWLRTPVLQELSVAGSVIELPQFLEESGCRLQQLTLEVPRGEAETVLTVLRGQPELSYLRLRVHCWSHGLSYRETMEVLVPQLTVSTGQSTVCPSLTSLDIELTQAGPWVKWEDAFCGMVESRRGSLEIVRIQGIPLSAVNTGRLESLRHQGITVTMI
ncbi:hypothetical protein R3P38DRAFT_150829 [Favolaschia claudopus]|uniref:F-box domain-containing protein n=1 Tax=Favolaschia claudopus TaxID=2862362 RepID=A0AAV9ZW45_9AGAR